MSAHFQPLRLNVMQQVCRDIFLMHGAVKPASTFDLSKKHVHDLNCFVFVFVF